jgi:hypothetical protein
MLQLPFAYNDLPREVNDLAREVASDPEPIGELHCLRCGHRWTPSQRRQHRYRSDGLPRACARCRTTAWDTPPRPGTTDMTPAHPRWQRVSVDTAIHRLRREIQPLVRAIDDLGSHSPEILLSTLSPEMRGFVTSELTMKAYGKRILESQESPENSSKIVASELLCAEMGLDGPAALPPELADPPKPAPSAAFSDSTLAAAASKSASVSVAAPAAPSRSAIPDPPDLSDLRRPELPPPVAAYAAKEPSE